MKKAIVIGSGIAGIATALRLNAIGFETTVLEQSAKLGGKIGEIKKGGYRWDKGPSLFTLPHLVNELFELYGEKPEDHFNYLRKKKVCNYFWEDGTQFIADANIQQFATEAALTFDENASKILTYLQNSVEKYNLTAPVFLDQSLHKYSSYTNLKTFKAFVQSYKLDLFESLHQKNEQSFKNEKLIQFFDRFATYNGSSPYQSPGIMSMIPALEMHYGTYFPLKGMRSIVDSLIHLGKLKGIHFHTNEKVTQIEVANKKAKVVISDKNQYQSDVVVSNMDVYFTYKKLLKHHELPSKVEHAERSSSALIFYWGIKRNFKQLDLHNIFFSDHYKEEFEHLFQKKQLHHDPTIYINISSKEKEDDAPENSENWFVMVNAPANVGQDWQLIINQARKNILLKLKRILNVDISPLIEVELVLDPIKIENDTSSYQGSLYGTASNSRYAAFLRHPNFSKSISNLYFCGGSVHPGGGIPLSLKSAKIVSDLIATEE